MSDATSPIDPAIAARLAALEALVAAQQAALEAERARRTDAEAERDRLREAYEALTREVELARRRLIVAKAERIDTTQLELEFAAKLAALDDLAGKVDDDERQRRHPSPSATGPRRSTDVAICACSTCRRSASRFPTRCSTARRRRIGTEESTGLRWKRGGFVRVVFVRFKYSTATPATVEPTTDASDDPYSRHPGSTGHE